ncbi:sensor histidine kinase [Sediminispirochaeta bajacaliforniensis]|uniref:sensor histidine kinase n=1 Tax=Sediminispirochaeta bajacaliforniensis TaxID=148 RepID=UPI00039B8E28|nr:sensor histidine kinase [Sediminispirochaeta bajacaliforniensis]
MVRKMGLMVQLLLLFALLFFAMLIAVVVLWSLAAEEIVSIWLPLLFSVFLATLFGITWQKIVVPFNETEKLLALFAAGYTLEGVYDVRYPYSAGMHDTLARLNELLQTRDLLQASKRQEQYLALQNQINPHFLYNTLEGIRSEALSAGVHSIAEMTEALSTFFRYTISTMDHLVTVEDELGNIETYFLIQQYRFGKRLQLRIEIDEAERSEIYAYRLPKLILQPIVENSILHGLERKVGEGLLRVQLETTETRLLITVSDDGVGMENEVLEELNRNLAIRSLSHVSGGRNRGGIAIVNVNNRIKLLFGEQYGVTITSTPSVGTDVEVVLPRIVDQKSGVQ